MPTAMCFVGTSRTITVVWSIQQATVFWHCSTVSSRHFNALWMCRANLKGATPTCLNIAECDFEWASTSATSFEQDDGTVYGNGVNVAARLESLAEPGGICLSGSAHEQVEGKTNHSFEDVGTHAVRNIARPVLVFRVTGREASGATAPEKPLASPARPSIAVLPFDNLSDDPEQEYFADGMAEDLITALSRIRWLLVIARNSTFTYKGQAVDVKRVGQEMGVRYVLEGSVRKGGDSVRVTAQLSEATTGNHIWAKRYDRKLADIFAIQDDLTEAIAGEIEPELAEVERERALSGATGKPQRLGLLPAGALAYVAAGSGGEHRGPAVASARGRH